MLLAFGEYLGVVAMSRLEIFSACLPSPPFRCRKGLNGALVECSKYFVPVFKDVFSRVCRNRRGFVRGPIFFYIDVPCLCQSYVKPNVGGDRCVFNGFYCPSLTTLVRVSGDSNVFGEVRKKLMFEAGLVFERGHAASRSQAGKSAFFSGLESIIPVNIGTPLKEHKVECIPFQIQPTPCLHVFVFYQALESSWVGNLEKRRRGVGCIRVTLVFPGGVRLVPSKQRISFASSGEYILYCSRKFFSNRKRKNRLVFI